MQAFITELLQCPACHGPLTWRVDRREGERIEEAEAQCGSCGATYPVREGIGIFLTPDLPRNDYWDASGSTLLKYLQDHPDAEQRMMGDPIEHLNPTDLFYRAGVLDATGHHAEAERLEQIARSGLYTPEQLAVTEQQMDHFFGLLSAHNGLIIDLASGRGTLAQMMMRRLPNPVVLTDFNPAVLREDRKRLTALGLYDKASLLSFDARRTPFRDGAVPVMTTYAGLVNIEHPGGLLRELRRIVSGRFLALSTFCPEDDRPNGELLKQAGMEQILFCRLALQNFATAGWQVNVSHAAWAKVAPTPKSDLIPGATVDGFPVAPSQFEFCVLDAR